MDRKNGMCDQDLKEHERKIKARFYRWVLHSYGGLWDKAAADVFALTGVDIPSESLRQNIEPVSKKAGKPPRSIKDPKRLKALKDFLISVNYLYEHELQDSDNSSIVVDVLSDFLSPKSVECDTNNLEMFRGRFIGERLVGSYAESIELYIDYASPKRTVKVTELSTLGYAEDEGLDNCLESEGWAVCNDNGFNMFFLRSQYAAKFYLVLQTSPSITGHAPIGDMALLSYESAWTGKLKKTVTTIDDGVDVTEYDLPKNIKDMCFFLTRG